MSDAPLLATLAELGPALEASPSPAALLSALAPSARALLPCTAAALALRGDAGWQVWRVALRRPQAVAHNPAPPTEAVATLERFLSHGVPLVMEDMLAPPWNESAHRTLLWRDGTRAALLLPLQQAGRARGALSFSAPHPHRFTAAQRHAATLLAWITAHALPPVALELP